MPIDSKFFCTNIRNYLLPENEGRAGLSTLSKVLFSFSCPINTDVEHFLKHNAIEFTKKSQSVTYLVFSRENRMLLGYFAIALKSLAIRNDIISNSMRRRFLRISELDEKSNTYNMPSYLIAQIGKNYANGADKNITGAELLELAWDVVEDLQYMAGGVMAFLEAENNAKLLSFYRKNKFKQFDTRQSSSSASAPHELVQLMRFI